MFKFVFVFCLTFVAALGKHETYDGHSLYNVLVQNEKQATFINALENQILIDTWMYASPDRPAQILVSKENKQHFEDILNKSGIEYTVSQENIKESLEREEQVLSAALRKRSNKTRSSIALPYDSIPTYDEVDNYLVQVAQQYPDLVTVASAGLSFQERDIKYLKISTTNFEDKTKPVVFIQSLLHAREWVTLPPTLKAIEKLVIDITERDLVEDIDWIIMPIANPDGYFWSHASDRFWRKNRRNATLCPGVDLNRNFDAFWGTESSSFSCSETYHGTGPFSEPETAAIRDVLLEHKDRLELYADLHSFGSIILYGYGNGLLPPNGLNIHVIAIAMAETIDAVKWAWKPNYRVGNIAMVLYKASGGSSDWAQLSGATHAYTYELPSYNNIQGSLQGFLVDPEFIEQAAFETWEGLKVGARMAANSFRSRMAERKELN